MKLRILLSTEGDYQNLDSISIRILRVADLLKRDYEVHTLLINKNVKNQNNVLESLYKNISLSIKQIRQAIKIKPDIIYCSFNFGGVIFYSAYAKISGSKIVFEIPGILSKEQEDVKTSRFKILIIKLLERINTKIVDYVICAGEDVTEFYKRYTTKIATIVNFIDTESFKIDSQVVQDLRCGHGILSHEKLIGVVGPFNTKFNAYYIEFLRKNFQYFDKNIKFLIIGSYTNPIVDPRIINVGKLPLEDYRKYVGSFDLLLAPNKVATTGPMTKILEAAAGGAPTITTAEGLLGLYYFENNKGLIVCSMDDIVTAVNNIIKNDDELNRLSKDAEEIVETYYSEKAVHDKMKEIFKTIL